MRALSETRAILLYQHDELREEIANARRAYNATPIDEAALKETLHRLVIFLRRHNSYEEECLRNVLPGLDAFGPVRKEVMIAEHQAEHHALHSTILAFQNVKSPETVRALDAMFDDLLRHMQREEDLFLSARVLDG